MFVVWEIKSICFRVLDVYFEKWLVGLLPTILSLIGIRQVKQGRFNNVRLKYHIMFEWFLIIGCLLSWHSACNLLAQCGPTTGPRATCGPPQRFQWRAEDSGKHYKFEICWKAGEVTFVSSNCLRWIKCICTRTVNRAFSVYHFCLMNLFYN